MIRPGIESTTADALPLSYCAGQNMYEINEKSINQENLWFADIMDV